VRRAAHVRLIPWPARLEAAAVAVAVSAASTLKDIYATLEQACDDCEDVANVIETIVMKKS
jgi:hypothetical protein